MTPFEALQKVSLEMSAVINRGKDAPFEAVCLTLCEPCTQALLADLAGFFPPMVADHTRTLAGSHIMGCTFSDGPPDQCALHPFLQEVAP